MDRYAKENASRIIDGYYTVCGIASQKHSFDKAKKEAIKNLVKQLKNVKDITFYDFMVNSGHKIKD